VNRSRLALIAGLFLAQGLVAQEASPATPSQVLQAFSASRKKWNQEHFTKAEYMVPMRDGKRLYTVVFTPKDTTRTYPILFERNTYSATGGEYGPDKFPEMIAWPDRTLDDGYIFIEQDVRGRYKSADAGRFVEGRPINPNPGPLDVDESTDSFDTIEWAVNSLPHQNGRVGLNGTSYLGFTAACGLARPHPAVKAAVIQAPVVDFAGGDDFRRGGALYLVHAFTFLNGLMQDHKAARETPLEGAPLPSKDAYRWFLSMGSVAEAGKALKLERTTSWSDLMAHPDYDAFWQAKNLIPHLKETSIPTLVVGGWFDGEDLEGTLRTYRALAAFPRNKVYLAMGPWAHGRWNFEEDFLTGPSNGSKLGDFTFGTNLALTFQRETVRPFLKAHLISGSSMELPKAMAFETGRNQWHRLPEWPPKGAQSKALYLGPNGQLQWEAPPKGRGKDTYISDPQHPVPHLPEPIFGYGAHYPVADQRFASTRPDVLVYQTDILTEDLTLAGPILADLWVATTGTDSDWIVKVIDVWSEDAKAPTPSPSGVQMAGYQQLVRAGILRGRYRKSLAHPTAMTPNRPTHIEVPLQDVFHTFQRGHRLMIQVQSTWFPLFDRNPQTFVDTAHAQPSDFKTAHQSVFRDGMRPSRLCLPVLAHPNH